MNPFNFLLIIGTWVGLAGCSLFHPAEQFEMERLSDDVLTSKNKTGISITILPITQPKEK